MSVTDVVFHAERSPPNKEEAEEEAPANILCMSVTPDRSGASVALYAMFEAPLNAMRMVDHVALPHWSIDASFWAFSRSL